MKFKFRVSGGCFFHNKRIYNPGEIIETDVDLTAKKTDCTFELVEDVVLPPVQDEEEVPPVEDTPATDQVPPATTENGAPRVRKVSTPSQFQI